MSKKQDLNYNLSIELSYMYKYMYVNIMKMILGKISGTESHVQTVYKNSKYMGV